MEINKNTNFFFKYLKRFRNYGYVNFSKNGQKRTSDIFWNHHSCSPNWAREMGVVLFYSVFHAVFNDIPVSYTHLVGSYNTLKLMYFLSKTHWNSVMYEKKNKFNLFSKMRLEKVKLNLNNCHCISHNFYWQDFDNVTISLIIKILKKKVVFLLKMCIRDRNTSLRITMRKE